MSDPTRDPAPPPAKPAIPDDPIERTGPRLRLREVTLDDAAFLDVRDADPTRAGEFNDFDRPPARPIADQLAGGKRMLAPDRGRLLIERLEDGAIVGDVTWHPERYGPNEDSQALNVGIALDPEWRGHGYGSEAQRLLAELLFATFPEAQRVEASTDVENVAEQRSLEKAGFVREGVLRKAQFRAGARHDLVVYSILRQDLDGA